MSLSSMDASILFESRGLYGQFPPTADRIDATGDCWIWNGFKGRDGYGRLQAPKNGGPKLAHRYVWEILVGPILDGLVLDHLCLVKECVNPDHLEPITQAENIQRNKNGAGPRRRREPNCKNGHPFSGDNLRMAVNGQRVCRICSREKVRRHRRKLSNIRQATGMMYASPLNPVSAP